MAHNNLQDFIRYLRENGELHNIEAEADPILEITEIYDRIVKKSGPCTFFQ